MTTKSPELLIMRTYFFRAHVGSLFGICGGMDPVGRLDDIAAVDVAAYVDVVLVEVGKHHQAVVVSGDHVGNIDSFRICQLPLTGRVPESIGRCWLMWQGIPGGQAVLGSPSASSGWCLLA